MKDENLHISYKKLLREKLDSYEIDFVDSNWNQFRKSIPGKKYFPLKQVAIVLSIMILGALCVFYYLNNSPKYTNKRNNKSFEKTYTNKHNNNNIISNSGNLNNINFIDSTEYNKEARFVNENKNSISKNSINMINNSHNDSLITENNTVTNNESKQKADGDLKISSSYRILKDNNCIPAKVHFIPVILSDSVIYYWEFGDGNFSNEKSPTHIYNEEGSYFPALTTKYYFSDSLSTTKSTEPIVVHKKPEVYFTYEKIDANKLHFEAVSEDKDIKALWIINDEKLSGNECYYVFDSYGKYPVKLIVENSSGCSSESYETINIEKEINIYMPNAFTPDNDGNNDYYGPITDCTDIIEYIFNIYDNQGNIVFTSNDINKKWDGRIINTNIKAKPGKYFWEYYIKTNKGRIIKDKGNLRIL